MDLKADVTFLQTLAQTLSGMILSASGWRGIFAESGEEESAVPGISQAHRVIAAAAAKVFSDFLNNTAQARGRQGKEAVIVGRDTRPTGKAIADAVIRVLLAEGREVRYLGAAAAPEIMAYARESGQSAVSGIESAGNSGANFPASGFIYISASHNPIGHNGIKFGLTDGGVLQADETALLVSAFKTFMASPDCITQIIVLLEDAGKHTKGKLSAEKRLSAVYASMDAWKKAALASYRDFSCEVVCGFRDSAKQEAFFAVLRNGFEKQPLAIAADFNGSARTLSIDRKFLCSLGAGFYALNEKPGAIVHRIVPEGESLDPCRAFLEELHVQDPSLTLGYVPDCDGDRGNIVIWDNGEKKARILEAQEVFALACMSELSSLVWAGELKYERRGNAFVRAAAVAKVSGATLVTETTKVAIAVNDPTSLRIDCIARAFGVDVFRAEVGEANVVGLARRLRQQGYLVRILGEGSAGGTIIHPSAVRDPLNTLGAILKLLAIRGGSPDLPGFAGGEGLSGMGLFEIWCNLSNQKESYREDFTLADIIACLPSFTSTGSYTEDALLKVKTTDHALLKERYQDVFLREWEEKKNILKEQFGISGWEAIAYNGMEERRGISRFSEAGRGGLKIEFYRGESPALKASGGEYREGSSLAELSVSGPGCGYRKERAAACIWMRGSGTEPVFRVMADASDLNGGGSDSQFERTLIEWQRRMVLEADNVES